MQKTIFITGATSGIGKACACAFARQAYRLILTGRRTERLAEVASHLQKMYGCEVLTLNFDVRDLNAVKSAIDNLPKDWQNIDVLINNAGLSLGLDFLHEGNPDDWDTMIDTNIKGLLYISRFVTPLLMQSTCPHIVNIGSIAGKEVYTRGNVYCATKFAVDALSRSMRIDLLAQGIKVSQIAPGAVETEFSEVRYKGDVQAAANVYKGFTPLKAEDVADAVLWVTGLPPHVNINDLVIMPIAQASPGYLYKQ